MTDNPHIRTTSAEELLEWLESAAPDIDDDLWCEIAIRLGVEGANGIRAANTWMPEAARLRAYIAGRREAEHILSSSTA